VEQPFFHYWRHAKLALLNRNNLLKADAPLSELEPWTNEFVKNAVHIDQLRSEYAGGLATELTRLIGLLLGEGFGGKFRFSYLRGWNPDLGLLDQLQRDIAKDRKYGFTSAGPHKADLGFQFGHFNAADILSRGQLKLLVCALKIAQSRLLYRMTGKNCIFLLDDLPAELDTENRKKICLLLAELHDQVFLTSIEEENLLPQLLSADQGYEASCKVFHVEHGIISEIGVSPT
jgi:DNA replication and repair protein RecF